jgi:hypothetical protein
MVINLSSFSFSHLSHSKSHGTCFVHIYYSLLQQRFKCKLPQLKYAIMQYRLNTGSKVITSCTNKKVIGQPATPLQQTEIPSANY